ncbi:MAG: metallophosphoesterase, partial [Candidatus Aminicenantes bacterium]|nr:metallophosphoesterase [Candidatus Aminicenantes bacterium]
INKLGYVYWAWWRKVNSEEMATNALQNFQEELKKEKKKRLFLVNVDEKKFYRATCVGIDYRPSGETFSPSEKNRIPHYYRPYRFCAWFKFTRIENITEAEYLKVAEFIPPKAKTLYVIVKNNQLKKSWIKLPISTFNKISAKGSTILHLSDIHFGSMHGFLSGEKKGFKYKKRLLDIIKAHFDQNLDLKAKVGIIVVTGDLISKAQGVKGFDCAYDFLHSLVTFFDIEHSHVIIIPGNHDLPFEKEKNPLHDYSYQRNYIKFLNKFYGGKTVDMEFARTYSTTDGWIYNFACFDSAKPRHKDLKNYGYVSEVSFDRIIKQIKDKNRDDNAARMFSRKKINIALLHHHVMPVALSSEPQKKEPVTLTLDAAALTEALLKNGFHFIFHGHQHIPFIGKANRGYFVGNNFVMKSPLYVIGGGSAGVIPEELVQDEMPSNTFGIYAPDEKGLNIKVIQYRAANDPKDYLNISLKIV